MKTFNIPPNYRSSIISALKEKRKSEDPRKNDFSPFNIDLGPVKFLIARHFGFCFGVENAIDIAYKTIEENKGKNIFFLSEMIHNPAVNSDLQSRGVKFIMDNYGNRFINWDEITSNDIVIIPAFGTTLETEKILKDKGIDTVKFNTTCPFVERVWNKAEMLGKQDFTIIIHGKHSHEETKGTFSHAAVHAPSVIVRNPEEAEFLAKIITNDSVKNEFYKYFKGKYSEGFDVEKDLNKIGIVNQTTMLAEETAYIAGILKDAMISRYGGGNVKEHFADTRDTLCYATNDNQKAVYGLLENDADLAIVIGGYNSSNTTHLVELLENKFPVYFISGAKKILSSETINHFDIHKKEEITTNNFFPSKQGITIALTSGASCPDSLVDEVLNKIISFFPGAKEFTV